MRALDDCIKEDKSKADKMFEELNCIKNYEDKYMANYKSPSGTFIVFEKFVKIVKLYNNSYIDMQELQAINEKCKELGWLDKEK